jgi:peptidoglycan-N-acetylglucosamine deacetylase
MRNKPLASISLDLDNLWSYMKTHGDEDWKNYPSYYEVFVPYVLDVLRQLDLKITFFIVGIDAAEHKNKIYLKMIHDEGHDIGNHSFSHEVWINEYSREQFEQDLEKAEKAIHDATGKRTKGFRGPGFSWNKMMMEVLYDHQYHYDASTLPTFIGPLARIYFFWKSDFSQEQQKKRKNLFGPFHEGFRRVKPYWWNLGNGKKLAEIPITTIPFFKFPFHLSYLVYLNSYSPLLMKSYLNIALFMCDITRTPVSFLLHPLDLLGGDKIGQLSFFPGMNVSSDKKIEIFRTVVSKLQRRYNVVSMEEYHKVTNNIA